MEILGDKTNNATLLAKNPTWTDLSLRGERSALKVHDAAVIKIKERPESASYIYTPRTKSRTAVGPTHALLLMDSSGAFRGCKVAKP
jgi:hypothetical protein